MSYVLVGDGSGGACNEVDHRDGGRLVAPVVAVGHIELTACDGDALREGACLIGPDDLIAYSVDGSHVARLCGDVDVALGSRDATGCKAVARAHEVGGAEGGQHPAALHIAHIDGVFGRHHHIEPGSIDHCIAGAMAEENASSGYQRIQSRSGLCGIVIIGQGTFGKGFTVARGKYEHSVVLQHTYLLRFVLIVVTA